MTIADIARMAGVSVSSVSNYFNRPGRVGAATAARIRAAVAKTGFVPDVHRPGPKTGERIGVKTGNIAFLHPGGGLLRRFLARPGIPRLLEGIERALEARRLRLLLLGAGEGGALPENFDSRSCDGLIVYGGALPVSAEGLLRGVRMVSCCGVPEEGGATDPLVTWDGVRAGEIAAEFLFRQGHRQVAVFNPDATDAEYRRRAAGFRRIAHSCRMEVTEFSVPGISAHSPAVANRILAGRFLHGPNAPTGAFFCSDGALTGVWRELGGGARGLELRHVIGCGADDATLIQLAPRPATVDLCFEEVGHRTVELLCALLRGEEPPGRAVIVRPVLRPGRFGESQSVSKSQVER